MSSSQYIWPVTTLEGEPSQKENANKTSPLQEIRKKRKKEEGTD
jgi:hypothetical protein